MQAYIDDLVLSTQNNDRKELEIAVEQIINLIKQLGLCLGKETVVYKDIKDVTFLGFSLDPMGPRGPPPPPAPQV